MSSSASAKPKRKRTKVEPSLKQRLQKELGKEADECIATFIACVKRLERIAKESKELGNESLINKIGRGIKRAIGVAQKVANVIGPVASIISKVL